MCAANSALLFRHPPAEMPSHAVHAVATGDESWWGTGPQPQFAGKKLLIGAGALQALRGALLQRHGALVVALGQRLHCDDEVEVVHARAHHLLHPERPARRLPQPVRACEWRV